jgi:hypothetical protein
MDRSHGIDACKARAALVADDCPRQWPLVRAFLERHGLLPARRP